MKMDEEHGISLSKSLIFFILMTNIADIYIECQNYHRI